MWYRMGAEAKETVMRGRFVVSVYGICAVGAVIYLISYCWEQLCVGGFDLKLDWALLGF